MKIAAITTYFNPARYRRRYINYERFAVSFQHHKIPLFTIEAAFGDEQFELPPHRVFKRIRYSSPFFAKENLFNIAVNLLPQDVSIVLLVDCDVEFYCDDFPEQILAAAEKYPVFQLYSELQLLGKFEFLSDGINRIIGQRSRHQSIASAVHRNRSSDQSMRFPPGSPGMGWGFRRSLLSRLPLYDYCIAGGGDKAIAWAALGLYDHPQVEESFHSASHLEDYRQWARRFYSFVRGDVGLIDIKARHYWHGHLTNRHYQQRREILGRASFTPGETMSRKADGRIDFIPHSLSLQQSLRQYFSSRKEDALHDHVSYHLTRRLKSLCNFLF